MKLKSYTKKDRYGNMTSFEFYEGASVDMGDIPPMMEGVPDHPGDPKGTDTVPAWLTPGEFVMNAEATRMFEPQIEEMNNAGRAVQAAQGGTIPEYAAGGGQMPAANIDGNEFAKAAMAVGLPTDNTTLNKLVNLVNQGMSVQEAAKRIANVPQYSADGGPVYLAEGGGLLDSLMGLFKSNPEIMSDPEVAKQVARATAEVSKDITDGEDLGNTPSVREATSLAPTMQNAAYMNLIKDTEGFKNEAYLDSAGVPTIGYGFTKGVKMGDTMDKETADKRLVGEMAITDKDYNNLVDVDLNPNQQAAVKSLLYNIGGPQFANSKARASLNSGDFEAFQKEAAEFRMANGKVIPGLENRREKELSLFNTPYVPLKDAVSNQVNPLKIDMGTPSVNPDVRSINKFGRSTDYQKVADKWYRIKPDGSLATDPATGLVSANLNNQKSPITSDSTTPSVAKTTSDLPSGSQGSGEYLPNAVVPSMETPPPTPSAIGMEDEYEEVPAYMQTKKMYGKKDYGPDIIYDSMGTPQPVNPNRVDSKIMEKLNQRLADGMSKELYDSQKATFDKAVKQDSAHKQYLLDKEADKKFDDEVSTNAKIAELENRKDEIGDVPEAQAKIDEEIEKLRPPVDTTPPSLVDTPPVVLEDEDMDQDAEAQKVLDNKESYEAEDEDLDNDQQQEEAVVIANKIIEDTGFVDDGTAGSDPEAAIEAGKTAPPEEVGKVESFLSGIFGDLFDTDELKRMAIMYVGSRVMGGTHAGAMNFSAKQYVQRVDAKVAAKKAEEKELAKEKRLDKKQLEKEHRQNVFDLVKQDKRTQKSISAYEKSKDPRDLVNKPVLTKPPTSTGVTKTFYDKGGRGKVTALEMKDDNGNTFYVNSKGDQLNPFAFHTDASKVKGTPEYQKLQFDTAAQMGNAIEDLITRYTVEDSSGKKKSPVGVKFSPGTQGMQVTKWMNKKDIPADYMGSILESAFASAAAEGKATGEDISDITTYLDKAFIDRIPGNQEIFTREDGKYVDSGKVMSLINQGVFVLRSKPGQESKSDSQLQNDMISEMRTDWFALDDKIRGEYNTKGTNAGETGFMVFMQQQIAEDVKQS